ncbi:MAG: hypothetical protein JWM10_815 [Myxococcaceae bacterium]|nr:hypothetical protein [Myxococcaceae bacterium]
MTTRNDSGASAEATAGGQAEPDGPVASALTASLPGPGIVERTGADAAAHARAVAREARHGGEPDPLDGLPERITASGDPSLAFDALVIGDAVALRDDDGPRFQSLRAGLRRAGVSLTEWTRALDVEARRKKAAAKESERERARLAAQARRDASDAGRAALAGEIAAAREARPDLAAHFQQTEVNGVTYSMTPGRVVMESMTSHGVRVVELANFSCPIVAQTLELETPNAAPRTTFTLSVLLGGGGTPREVDINAERFTHMEWVEPVLGPARSSPRGRARGTTSGRRWDTSHRRPRATAADTSAGRPTEGSRST